MDKINIKRGKFLKQIREENGYTERDLAEIMGVERSDITVWEIGLKFPEDSYTVEKLAKILNVTKREILNGEYNRSKKDADSYEEADTDEYEEREHVDNSGVRKSILLVGLACVLLFILIFAVASLIKPNGNVYKQDPNYVVSDKRETIYHTPRKSNEHIVYNTQALESNVVNDNYDNLLKYGFEKVDSKYVKVRKEYTIEFYDDVFHMTLNKKKEKYYFEENLTDKLIVTKVYSFDRMLTIKIDQPRGKQNCDEVECRWDADYYRYLTFLIDEIRG